MGRGEQKFSNGLEYKPETHSDLSGSVTPAAVFRSLMYEGRNWKLVSGRVAETFSLKDVIRNGDSVLPWIRQLNVLTVSHDKVVKFAAISSQMVGDGEWNCHLIGDRLCTTIAEAEELVSIEDKKIEAKGGDDYEKLQVFDSVRRFLRDDSGAGL